MSVVLRLLLAVVLGAGGLEAAIAAAPPPRPETPPLATAVGDHRPLQRPEAPAREPLDLTLEEALRRAREAAPRLAELRAARLAAEARLDRAEAGRLPRIDARAGYTRRSNVPELFVERRGELQPIFPNIPDNWRLELALDVPLYTGGRLEAERRGASHEVDALRHDVEAAAGGLDLAVTTAFWDLTLSRERERILAASIRSFESHLEDARNRLEVGLAAPNEPLAVQVELDRAELRRLRASRAAEVAGDRLAILLDLPPDRRIQPVAQEPVAESPAQSVDEMTATALEQRRERAALQERVESARARVQALSSGDLPRVTAAAGLQYDNPNRRVLPPEADFEHSWDLSVNVDYTIFDGGRLDADVAANLAEVDALREQLAGLDREIRLDVRREYRDLETSVAAVEVARRAVDSARESLRVATDRYRAGVIPSSERLDAEVAELRAGLELSEALISVRLARARLERAVGQ